MQVATKCWIPKNHDGMIRLVNGHDNDPGAMLPFLLLLIGSAPTDLQTELQDVTILKSLCRPGIRRAFGGIQVQKKIADLGKVGTFPPGLMPFLLLEV